MKDGGKKEKLGCWSEDPDKDDHNWPEYTDRENGDEISTCKKCGVDFFGYHWRDNCYVCATGD